MRALGNDRLGDLTRGAGNGGADRGEVFPHIFPTDLLFPAFPCASVRVWRGSLQPCISARKRRLRAPAGRKAMPEGGLEPPRGDTAPAGFKYVGEGANIAFCGV